MEKDSNLSGSQDTKGFSILKPLLSVLWICSIVISGFIGYTYGRGDQPSQTNAEKNTLAVTTNQITNTPVPASILIPIESPSPENKPPIATPSITPTIVPESICGKTGFAQKWEYLTTYVIKQNDSLQSIAMKELNDLTRTNEILQINGVGPLIVESTLYLPPQTVQKSSGNLKKVYGKLAEKNAVRWHVKFSNDTDGVGLLIPAYWFEGIKNIDSFKIGDCVEVFFDDGNKVFSVSLQ